MAYIKFNEIWENEFDNILSEKDKMQDFNLNHL